MLLGVLHLVSEAEDPWTLVATLMDAAAPGSRVARFFTGLELVEPGLVQVHQWHPDPEDSAPEGAVSAHAG